MIERIDPVAYKLLEFMYSAILTLSIAVSVLMITEWAASKSQYPNAIRVAVAVICFFVVSWVSEL